MKHPVKTQVVFPKKVKTVSRYYAHILERMRLAKIRM